jgi:hypothetical protein
MLFSHQDDLSYKLKGVQKIFFLLKSNKVLEKSLKKQGILDLNEVFKLVFILELRKCFKGDGND